MKFLILIKKRQNPDYLSVDQNPNRDHNQAIITSVPQSNFESSQHKEKRILKSVASDKINYDFCCDTENLQLAIDIVQKHYDVLTDTTITDMIKPLLLGEVS